MQERMGPDDHDEQLLNVSCLQHRKLDKQVRRQVKRVTSATVMLMQVVSPVLMSSRKKFREVDTPSTASSTTNSTTVAAAAAADTAAVAGAGVGVVEGQNNLTTDAGVDMDPASNAERIVQCVHKHHHHQDNRMLSPGMGETGSPDVTEYRGSYRYCSPQHFPRTASTTVLHPVPDEVEPPQPEQHPHVVAPGGGVAAAALSGKKTRAKSRVRSLSMSVICNEHNFGFSDSDCHTAPLMCLDEDEASLGGGDDEGEGSCCQEHVGSSSRSSNNNANCKGGVRRNHHHHHHNQQQHEHHHNPLRRQIGSLFGCFLGGMRRENGGETKRSSWEKGSGGGGIGGNSSSSRRRALALLELSRRQQNALAMKQDTIELLQWKLEQLQLLSSAAVGPPHHLHLHDLNPPAAAAAPPVQEFPCDLQQQYIPSNKGFSTYCPDVEAEAEALGKSRQDHCHHHLHLGIASPHHRHIHQHHSVVDEQPLPSPIPPPPPYLQGTLKLESAEMAAILNLFDSMVVKARLAVRYFCKAFMKQMEISGYSVWRTLAEVEPNTKFLKKEHTAFILESRLNKALYHSFENDSFDETGLTRIIDPEKRCIVRFRDFQRLKAVEACNAVNSQHEDFDQEFWQFSENKMREMWFLFPWNVVFKDSQERSSFTAAFLDAAKCVWLLHRLAFSIYPNVTILRVGKGMHANSQYVEQVTPIDEGCTLCEGGPKVEFMSMPGFQIRKKVIKCQVYRHLQCR